MFIHKVCGVGIILSFQWVEENMVLPAGIEPASQASEARGLSISLREQSV